MFILNRNQSVHQDYRECATRFIALAPVGNKVKEKWIYACSLQPISTMRVTDLLQATTDETPCPYDPELMKQHQPGKVVKVMKYYSCHHSDFYLIAGQSFC